MFLFRCVGCKRVWTRCLDGSCPDVDCNCACEVIDGNSYSSSPTPLSPFKLYTDDIGSRPSLPCPVKTTAYSLTGGQQIFKNRIQVNTTDLSDNDEEVGHIEQHHVNRKPISVSDCVDEFEEKEDDIAINSELEIDFSRILNRDDTSSFVASLTSVYLRISKATVSSPVNLEEQQSHIFKSSNNDSAYRSKQVSPDEWATATATAPAPTEPQTKTPTPAPTPVSNPSTNPSTPDDNEEPQPETKPKGKKKKKNKSQVQQTATPESTTPTNTSKTTTTTSIPNPKSKPKSKKTTKSNQPTAKIFKVDLPLPDFLQPPSRAQAQAQAQATTTPGSSQTNTQLPIPFATAASLPNNTTTSTDSAWTTIPITSRLKRNKPTANAPSHLSTQPGGAFGYRHEDISQDSHIGVEYEMRGAKHLSRRVVPRL